MLPDGTDILGRRHYSIRRFDPASRRLDIDLVLHSDSSPGARWALTAGRAPVRRLLDSPDESRRSKHLCRVQEPRP